MPWGTALALDRALMFLRVLLLELLGLVAACWRGTAEGDEGPLVTLLQLLLGSWALGLELLRCFLLLLSLLYASWAAAVPTRVIQPASCLLVPASCGQAGAAKTIC